MLGCAGLVGAHPGAIVVTVAAGRPGRHPLTDWDRRCGFADGDDVVGARRREDEEALKLLDATPVWLDFLDHQYGPPPAQPALAAAIEQALAGADLVASPLGLFHEDHVLTAGACFDVARRNPGLPWLVYEDAIYRATHGRSATAVSELENDGFVLRPVEIREASLKRAAIEHYPSQVRGLGHLLSDAFRPERYWELASK